MTSSHPRLFALVPMVTGAIALLVLSVAIAPRLLGFVPGVIGVAAFGGLRLMTGGWPKIPVPALVWTGVLLALSALSALWAADAGAVIEKTLKMAGLIGPCLLLLAAVQAMPQEDLERTSFRMPLALLGLSVVFVADLLAGMPLFAFLHPDYAAQKIAAFSMNKEAGVIVLTFLPLAAIAWRGVGWEPVAMMALWLVGVLALTDSQSSLLACFVGVAMVAVFPARWAFARWGVAAAICGGILAAPWIAQFLYGALLSDQMGEGLSGEAAAGARLEIWNFLAGKIVQSPLLGYGLDSTRDLTFDAPLRFFPGTSVLHPHNAALELWVNFGVVGALAGCGFVCHMVYAIGKIDDPWMRSLGLAQFCAFVSMTLVGWSLWQGWWMGLVFLSSALFLMAARMRPRSDTFEA